MAKNKLEKGLKKMNDWGNKGKLYFESITLRNILDEIERQFKIQIICKPAGLADQLYTGYIINTHLDSALMSICWPLRIRYERVDSAIVLSRV